jgi:hypothetical protein
MTAHNQVSVKVNSRSSSKIMMMMAAMIIIVYGSILRPSKVAVVRDSHKLFLSLTGEFE